VKRGELHADRFVLEACLGRGGMGEVWRARETKTEERVALKFLREDLAQDGDAKKRFVREARLAARVRHPNVVTLLAVEDAAAQPFLVMELLVGETLGARLRRKGPLSCAEVAAIALPMFDAVEAAHAAGIVHRDLKPDNVFVARDGKGARVRVLDFGIAKQMESLAEATGGLTTAGLNTTSAMLGTPYYMAPEQALGERDVDARADLWSIGIILYECLSGKRPTEAPTLGAILKILVTDSIVPLAEQMPDLDPHLADEVMDLLRSNRDDRATSLTALRTTLLALSEDKLALDLPDALETGADEEPAPSLAEPPMHDTGIPARAQRRKGWAASAGAIALIASAVGVAFAMRPAPAVSSSLANTSAKPDATLAAAAAAPMAVTLPSTLAASSPAVATTTSAKQAMADSTVALTPSTLHDKPGGTAAGRAAPGRTSQAAPVAANTSAPLPSASAPAPASTGLGRGPSGLVVNNPFPAP
jgi:eukaryotic-like serine/threonine-protein kinase